MVSSVTCPIPHFVLELLLKHKVAFLRWAERTRRHLSQASPRLLCYKRMWLFILLHHLHHMSEMINLFHKNHLQNTPKMKMHLSKLFAEYVKDRLWTGMLKWLLLALTLSISNVCAPGWWITQHAHSAEQTWICLSLSVLTLMMTFKFKETLLSAGFRHIPCTKTYPLLSLSLQFTSNKQKLIHFHFSQNTRVISAARLHPEVNLFIHRNHISFIICTFKFKPAQMP